MYMYIGVKRENVIADTTGRWNLIIGAERGNAKIEARQMKTGRPWSAMAVSNVVQLPQMPQPTINPLDSSHYWVSRKRRVRSNIKATCSPEL